MGVVRPARLERATFWFVAKRSIQLSYGRLTRSVYRIPSHFRNPTAMRLATVRRVPPKWDWSAMHTINLTEKFSLFQEQWRPKVVARLNGQQVKLIKVQGVFPWHTHGTEDEMFLVWRGEFRVEFRDRVVRLGPGEMVVVPAGVEHRTAADEEAEVLCFEPAGVRNTGDIEDAQFTAPQGVAL